MLRRLLPIVGCGALTLGVVAVVPDPASAAPPAPTSRPRLAAQAHGAAQPAVAFRRSGAAAKLFSRHWASPRVLDPRLLSTDRSDKVTVSATGTPSTVATRARSLGGRVLVSSGTVSSVLIDRARVARLENAAGVGRVTAPVRAVAHQGPVSEGAALTRSAGWAGPPADDGAGATVAVVDLGFTGYEAAVKAGDLPDGTTVVNDGCTDNDDNVSVESDQHGTATAEIVHQTAPKATLKLYCIADTTGLARAATDIAQSGIKIVSMSLGFSGDSRGDGTGDSTSAAAIVRASRRQGVLWVVSAGNDAADHWSGTLADTDRDGRVDIDGTYNPAAGTFENDVFFVAGGSTQSPAIADVVAQWDSWPTTRQNVSLQLTGFQCTAPYDSDGDCQAVPIGLDAGGLPVPTGDGDPSPVVFPHDAGASPVLGTSLVNFSQYEQFWLVQLLVPAKGYPSTRYDLTYGGDVSGPSVNACSDYDDNNFCIISPRSSQGSVASPANSPYALAVGAANAGGDGTTVGTLEQFSSRGPTIDGRTKPEITGWDGVSSPVYGAASNDPNATTGFYGTSAAAPHVAAAAALVLGADPSLDAAEIQDVLLRRAGRFSGNVVTPGAPFVPAQNSYGAGLLTLGDAPTAGADLRSPGSRYTPITPTRLIDTRTKGFRVGAGGAVLVPLPGLPADATSVAVNITGAHASGATFLSAYPGATYPGTSNLNLSATDPTAAAFAVVPVYRGFTQPSITVRNGSGVVDIIVDELGYFGTGSSETGRYTTLAKPTRVLDTRTTTGGHKGALANHGSATVAVGVPAGATAAVVNVTAAAPSSNGFLAALPSCGTSVSTLNYAKYTRAALSVVPLSGKGTLCLTNAGPAVNAVIDVVGYLSPSTGGAEYHALPVQQRVVDTRSGNGGSAGGSSPRPLAAATTTTFYGANVGSVPASATALMTSVVEAGNTAGGFLTLSPGVTSTPTSNLNFTTGRVVSNAALVGLSTAHVYNIYNPSGSTNVAVDAVGYFAPAPSN